MKFSCPCSLCNESPPHIETYEISIPNDFCFEYTCKNGHRNFYLIQTTSFELLFEQACEDIINLNYRSAVLNFASSLECYYEFTLLVDYLSKGGSEKYFYTDIWIKKLRRNKELQEKKYLNIINRFSKRSQVYRVNTQERQFRNRVVHQGTFPSKRGVLTYGKKVFQIITSGYFLLKENHSDIIQNLIFETLNKNAKLNKTQNPPVTISLDLGIVKASGNPDSSFEETLKDIGEWNNYNKGMDTCFSVLNLIGNRATEADIKLILKSVIDRADPILLEKIMGVIGKNSYE